MRGRLLVVGDNHWPLEPNLVAVSLDAPSPYSLRAGSGSLEVHVPEEGWTNVVGVIWRGQFDTNFRREHDLLSLLTVTEVPCVNSVSCLLASGVRATGNHRLTQAGLPVLEGLYFWGRSGISYDFEPVLPAVLKVGNWQQGFGKAKADNLEQWQDLLDLAVTSDEIICVEPFVPVSRDLRCLTVYGRTIAIERRGRHWKANVNPYEVRMVELPAPIASLQAEAVECLGADIAGVDWIQLVDGTWKILEVNLSPGLASRGLFDFRSYVLECFRQSHCLTR